jgi:hypothetical protein
MDPSKRTPLIALVVAAVTAVSAATSPSGVVQGAAEGTPPPALTAEEQAFIDQAAANLAAALAANRVDYAVDDLPTILQKINAVRRAASAHERAMLDALFDPDPLVLDYSMYVAGTAPRLTGRIVRIGPNRAFEDFASALPSLQAGDLVILDAGEYEIGRDRSNPALPSDIAILGQGPEATTLRTGQVQSATRMRLANLAIDCNNSPFIDLDRNNGRAQIVDCRIYNYNSGAGGSNAIYGTDSVLLIERCLFEGLSGRSYRPGSGGGNAFDLRGENALFVRQSQFVDNAEICRSSRNFVFDACISSGDSRGYGGVSGEAYVRDNRVMTYSLKATNFTYALDDIEVVRFASDPSVGGIDETTMANIERLQLSRRLPYWIPLVRHDDPAVREIALAQVIRLTGLDPDEMLIAAPDDPGVELNPPLEVELIYSALMNWFEQNRAKLRWDDSLERYVVAE